MLRAEARPGGRTALAGQSFRAPYYVGKSYLDTDSGVLMVQVANPTAGILSGDRLESAITVAADAKLLVTTPSASRVFPMNAGEAVSRQTFAVETGGWLEMLPEPLVPHRRSTYRQDTSVEIAAGGGVFFVEQLMPGRVGHGEAWEWDRLVLTLDVRVDGEWVLRERFDQSGASLRAMAVAAGTGPESCFANGLVVVPGADAAETNPAWREALHALHGDGVWIGATALGAGAWSLRIVAANGVTLRAAVQQVRAILAEVCPALRCGLRKL